MVNAQNQTINDPIDAIWQDLDRFGWDYSRLAAETGFRKERVWEFLNRKRKLPMSFIRAYHAIPDTTPLETLIKDYELEAKP